MAKRSPVAVCALVVLSAVLLVRIPVSAAPSADLSSLLESRLPALPGGKATLQGRVMELIRQGRESQPDLHISFSIEYVGKAEHQDFSSSPERTLRECLDSISAQANYVWEANGDWINFIPRNRANDPNYILNQKMPGTIVVSRDSSKHTSVKNWFTARRASSARDVHRLKVKGFRPTLENVPDAIILANPTLRDYVNDSEALYGNDTWTVQVVEYPPKEGETEPRISLLWWGQNRRELVPVEPPSK